MLRLLKGKPSYLCDRISRREWLRLGGLGNGQVLRGLMA
jgi:hypothetical protein